MKFCSDQYQKEVSNFKGEELASLL